jgi:hypothetical protein
MPEKPLQVRLEATNQHSGQYTLTFDTSQYPVTLNLDNFTIGDWLRRVRPVLAGGNDPAGSFDPQDDLLRNVGTWFWQALLPSQCASSRTRDIDTCTAYRT